MSPFERDSDHNHNHDQDNVVAALSSPPAAAVALDNGNALLLWQRRRNIWIPLVLVSITCPLVGAAVMVPLLVVDDNDDGHATSSLSLS